MSARKTRFLDAIVTYTSPPSNSSFIKRVVLGAPLGWTPTGIGQCWELSTGSDLSMCGASQLPGHTRPLPSAPDMGVFGLGPP